LTQLLAEKRISRSCLREPLPEQLLDGPVGLGDRCAVRLQRCRDASLEVEEGDLRRPLRDVEREPKIIQVVHRRSR
jgi:hypothetical protein